MTQNGKIDRLISERKAQFSLPQAFYKDPDLFTRDIDRLVARQWLLVDHVSRIPNPGDYFLFEIADESIIIVRGKDGGVRSFYNVCRHRGSRVCLERQGNVRLFVCPYHAWSYGLDGALRGARQMPEGFDPAEHGLHSCHTRILEGLIFIKLSEEDPGDFDEEMAPFVPYLQLHGIANAKVAARGDYPTDANWKLVLENFFECYHCAPAHPEYCAVHSKQMLQAYGAGPGSGTPEAIAAFQDQLDAFHARCADLGHPVGDFLDPADADTCRSFDRVPIRPGFLSETQDGQPAAPLMGQFKDFDGGLTSISFNPFATLLMNNDFTTVFRFTPRGPLGTDVELIWLVDAKAEEGKDYDVEKIKWLWDVTTISDKTIIENNHKGVMSSRYQPGPYSAMETAVERLVDWYLNQIR